MNTVRPIAVLPQRNTTLSSSKHFKFGNFKYSKTDKVKMSSAREITPTFSNNEDGHNNGSGVLISDQLVLFAGGVDLL